MALALAVATGTTAVLAAIHVYDLTINVTAKTLVPEPASVKVAMTGTMTYNDVTGAFAFAAVEDGGVELFGAGLLGVGPKLQAIGKTTFDAGDRLEPWFTATAFFVGKFGKGFSKFSDKFYAVCDSFGPAPQGYTFNSGTVKAVPRTTPIR